MTTVRKILLFGSTGVVGTAFQKVCGERGIEYYALGHQDIEVTDRDQVLESINRYRPRVIINCVAVPSIEPCEKDPETAINLHCNFVMDLARECEIRNVVLVQPSSHAVFDGAKRAPYLESDQPKATSVYAATKLLTERIAATYCSKCYIPRFSTLYGPRKNSNLGFVDRVILWIREGRELRIADDKMDSPTYSIDAAWAIINLMEDDLSWGVYHIANEGYVSYYQFVCQIKKKLNVKNEIHGVKDKEFSGAVYKPLRTALASEKVKALRNWKDALADYLDHHVRF